MLFHSAVFSFFFRGLQPPPLLSGCSSPLPPPSSGRRVLGAVRDDVGGKVEGKVVEGKAVEVDAALDVVLSVFSADDLLLLRFFFFLALFFVRFFFSAAADTADDARPPPDVRYILAYSFAVTLCPAVEAADSDLAKGLADVCGPLVLDLPALGPRLISPSPPTPAKCTAICRSAAAAAAAAAVATTAVAASSSRANSARCLRSPWTAPSSSDSSRHLRPANGPRNGAA
mmetsp:Transcript_24042/g.69092  ORF Transcript_24042/g.69092 Transcript_24042/m.69092 type:complete len:229 (-) Transcript_24042:308-994(-)